MIMITKFKLFENNIDYNNEYDLYFDDINYMIDAYIKSALKDNDYSETYNIFDLTNEERLSIKKDLEFFLKKLKKKIFDTDKKIITYIIENNLKYSLGYYFYLSRNSNSMIFSDGVFDVEYGDGYDNVYNLSSIVYQVSFSFGKKSLIDIMKKPFMDKTINKFNI